MNAVILNPAAGHGKARELWTRSRPGLERALGPLRLYETRSQGHAGELCRSALAEGARRIVAFGGDGTFREAAEGLLSIPAALRPGVSLGLFPAGSGCDMARHLGYPPGADAVGALLAGGKVRFLDAIRAEFTAEDGSRALWHLTNMAAFGIPGEVVLAMRGTGKPLGGTLSYLLVTLGALLRSRPLSCELVLDGERLPESGFHAVILANTSSTGGGMRVAPEADAQDGVFELLTIGDMSRGRMLLALPGLYRGRRPQDPGVRLRRGRRLEARLLCGSRAPLNLDGESAGSLPASFEILPGALPVIAP